MSTLVHVLLFRPTQFDRARLDPLINDSGTMDDVECLQFAALRNDLHGVRYVPPVMRNPSVGWDYGLEFFNDTLSFQLSDVLDRRSGALNQIVMFSWDDARATSSVWRVGTDGEERRWLNVDGTGLLQLVDARGELVTTTGSVVAGSDVPRAQVATVEAQLRAPYLAEPVLQATFGLRVDALLKLVAAATWERFWPTKPREVIAPVAPKKKPVAKKKKPAAKATKKPVAKKPVAKKPVAKKPAAKPPIAKKPVAKKPVAKKPARRPH